MLEDARLLLVDDDPQIRESLGEAIAAWGTEVHLAASAEEGLAQMASLAPDVVLSDVRMSGMSGLNLLGELRQKAAGTDVILMTAYDDMPTVVAAMKGGAVEFLVKPIDLNELRAVLMRVLEDRAARCHERTNRAAPFNQLVGRNASMIEIYKRIGQAAATRATVLVRGESGTGKELIARAIHANSDSADEPFVAVNCTALPSTLLETELFGHARGAFTGAVNARRGCFAVAGRGTVFLDEIGDTSLEFQSKLLRVLQSREFQPIGSEQTLRTEARVIAATHRNLEALIEKEQFREDLYYRLRVVEIIVPPLRERSDDIPLLVQHLLETIAQDIELAAPVVSDEALDVILAHSWPGNVRELENCLTRAAVIAAGGVIRPPHLAIKSGNVKEEELGPLSNVERDHIERVLRATGGQKNRAAEILQMTRPRLNRLLRRYGLD
ncbi:MAG TPA: sigma-54 dependent transcriptional regulator [Longimicrobiales bacterium]|nr:sigma-54 dependent transcriptional regulator [Longimicrobiales bacterium]